MHMGKQFFMYNRIIKLIKIVYEVAQNIKNIYTYLNARN